MRINDNGWSSRAWLEGDWLHRAPRRDDVRPHLLAEAQLLPWLAPQLPLPVPVPQAEIPRRGPTGFFRCCPKPAGGRAQSSSTGSKGSDRP